MSNVAARIAEIDILIAQLQEEKARLLGIELETNPYANLKTLGNKAFGEGWSEPWVASKCPSLVQDRHTGYDLVSEALGRVELKSTRLPLTKITYNQCHPGDCDYFLFIDYNTVDGTEDIFLMPSTDFHLIHPSVQHGRNSEAQCYSATGCSCKRNAAILENYRVNGWEELEKIAGGNE